MLGINSKATDIIFSVIFIRYRDDVCLGHLFHFSDLADSGFPFNKSKEGIAHEFHPLVIFFKIFFFSLFEIIDDRIENPILKVPLLHSFDLSKQ